MTESLQARFYVATTGSDAWSGRHAQPISGGTDGPFATLARARDAVRELTARIRSRDATPDGEIRVEVRAGRYYLREPLCLGPADSGSAGCPVTYAAYPGEEPILSGGVRLTDWQPFAGEILRCELPADVRGELARFRQLVLDGKRQRRARWPKFEPDNPIHGGWAFVEGPAREDSHNAFVYRPGTFTRRWANPRQVEVNIYPYKGWCNCIVPLASIDEESRTIRLAHDVWDVRTRPPWYWSMPLCPGNRFFVENALEELDRPGEWCLDLDRRHVYFWPPAPLTPDSEVVLPVLDRLIDLQNASHINLSGLTLTETTSGDNMHRTGLDGYGAQLPTPGWTYAGEAIHLRDTHHVTIEGNRIRTVGGNAVYLEGYNSRNEIRGNEVDGCGANGIALIGTADRHPVDNRVADNDIHHCGAINKFVAGVFLGLSDGTTVQHNAIHDVPHHAINLGSNGYGRNVWSTTTSAAPAGRYSTPGRSTRGRTRWTSRGPTSPGTSNGPATSSATTSSARPGGWPRMSAATCRPAASPRPGACTSTTTPATASCTGTSSSAPSSASRSTAARTTSWRTTSSSTARAAACA